MAEEPSSKDRMLAVISQAVLGSCHEYFSWTKGGVLYDAGVERLLDTSIARALHDNISVSDVDRIYLNRQTGLLPYIRELPPELPFRHGLVDISARIAGIDLVVETKIGMRPVDIRRDLERVSAFVSVAKTQGANALGCVVGCEFLFANDLYSYEGAYEERLRTQFSVPDGVVMHILISPPEPLDGRYKHAKDRDRALSIIVSFQ